MRGITQLVNFGKNIQKLNRNVQGHPIRYFSSSDSFIQTVINQVKRDLEKDKNLKEAIQELENKAHISEKYTKFTNYLSKTRDFGRGCITKIAETKDNSKIIQFCLQSAKSAAVGIDKVASMLHDEKKHARVLKERWKAKSKERTEAKEATVAAEVEAEVSTENALVLAKESAWDRFGSKLRDMPFLRSVFDNPYIGSILSKSTLSTAIQDMKRLDPSFNIPELVEMVEHVIAPHVVDCYLQGDHESLKIHCGECAFNVLNTSIKERNIQKLSLDPSVLILKDVELKGGMSVQEGDPWFIFNFTTQQINCLRDHKGNVCAGQIDDIREVVYSMAISRHPNINVETLEYPYMIHEIAIISNRPSW